MSDIDICPNMTNYVRFVKEFNPWSNNIKE